MEMVLKFDKNKEFFQSEASSTNGLIPPFIRIWGIKKDLIPQVTYGGTPSGARTPGHPN